MKDFLKRISSRKFIFWIAATVLLLADKLSGSEWLIASGIFIGGKAIEMMATAIKKE